MTSGLYRSLRRRGPSHGTVSTSAWGRADGIVPHATVFPNASKLAEVHGKPTWKGGTQRWSQTFAGFSGNALFYGVFASIRDRRWESHSLRHRF
jgi:hypothetical protein